LSHASAFLFARRRELDLIEYDHCLFTRFGGGHLAIALGFKEVRRFKVRAPHMSCDAGFKLSAPVHEDAFEQRDAEILAAEDSRLGVHPSHAEIGAAQFMSLLGNDHGTAG
jgi:hypothetical protein